MALKHPKYQIVVHNDNENSFDYVVDMFMTILGHEKTQAANCAMIIHHKGKCVVKSMNDKEIAESTVELLLDHGLDAELLNLSKK